ncbi:MAG: rod shape-determining protein MreC [Anaerolineae bacterium]
MPRDSRDSNGSLSEIAFLKSQNEILRTQVERLSNVLFFEERLSDKIKKIEVLAKKDEKDPFWKDYFDRRQRHLLEALALELRYLPALVIYREPTSWSSFFWIDVGQRDNRRAGQTIIAKNSPVIVGSSIIGLIEEVKEMESRVRLITDSNLTPSVRAVRGPRQNCDLAALADTFLKRLLLSRDLTLKEDVFKQTFEALQNLKKNLAQEGVDRFLAKGELFGSSRPLWRSRDPLLKGVGFNYDFSDEEGPSRDLRSGLFHEGRSPLNEEAILKSGDLLVTTGMDGVFPAGFHVAVVQTVKQLKEGASSYEIEALATVGNLEEITQVFVLPPIASGSFD